MKLTIYTKPNCQPCRITKNFLDKNEIEFEEINGLEHIDELRKDGFATFPVVKTETDAWSGLQPKKLKALVS